MTFRQINLSAVNTSISSMTDPLIAINSAASGSNTKDLGMIFGRGSDTNVALLWDESTDQFAFINTDEAGLTAGNVTISSYSDLKVNDLIADNVTGATIVATTGFTGNLTGNVVGSTTGINYGNVTSNVGTSTFNNITMAGNLIVNGSTTTVSSTNTTLTDNLIELNTGAGDNDADAGIVIERGTTGDNAFMGWDESSDSFILGTTTATGASIGNLTITPTALQLGSLDITDTTAGSDAGPIVTLHRDITGADANYIGQIKFTADNDANQSTVFAKITGKIDDASDGTEDGIIEIAHKKAGSNNISARFTSTDLKLINGTGLEVAGETTLQTHLNMGDGDMIKLGDGADLQLYHDGSHSYIDDVGTGNLRLRATNLFLQNSDNSKQYITMVDGGAVSIHHDGVAKVTTSSSGVTVSGNIELYNDDVDGYIWFHDSGTRSWSVGSDQSTGNFVITHAQGITSAPKLSLDSSGNITATGDITAYSDERLKDNIQTIDGALGKVNSMRGVTYTKDGLESSGVIAQEIEKIAPELVKDGEYKSVAYGNLVGYLIEAIKEQQIQIEQSKTEIDNLKKLIGE